MGKLLVQRSQARMSPAPDFQDTYVINDSVVVDSLHYVNVQASAEFLADLFHDANMLEPLGVEKVDACFVTFRDSGNHRVKTSLLSFFDNCLQELSPDTFFSMFLFDVQRDFCGVGVCASGRTIC